MTTLTLDQLADLRDRVEDYEAVRPYYGGRGMYGDKCLGYVGDDPILFAFDLAVVLADDGDWEDASAGEVRDAIAALGAPRSDSMGHSTIWYWPGVTVEAGDLDGEDDE